MSSLGRARLASLTCSIPPAGGWLAEVWLEGGAPPAVGPTTLTIGDLALVGTVIRSGDDDTALAHAVVVGGAGWRRELLAGSYSSPSGVRLTTVLRDLAARTGEPLAYPAEARIGPSFGWPGSSPALRVYGRSVLTQLIARKNLRTWRVTPDGTTRFDLWPALAAADSKVRVITRDRARGVRRLGLDKEAASILPGATVEGATIARVTYREDAGELTAEVWES